MHDTTLLTQISCPPKALGIDEVVPDKGAVAVGLIIYGTLAKAILEANKTKQNFERLLLEAKEMVTLVLCCCSCCFKHHCV